jgi:hypothetical protein
MNLLKKLCLTTFLLAASWSMKSQDFKPIIKSVYYDQFTSKGVLEDLDGKQYPIHIQISIDEGSQYYLDAHSVKGWYYYDRYKEKIPLAGIMDKKGLVLFHFKDEKKMEQILKVNDNSWNDWEWSDYIKNRRDSKGFIEKFDFSSQIWTSQKRALRFEFESEWWWKLATSEEFLKFSKEDSILLASYNAGYELIAYNNNNFILEYGHPSTRDLDAMCSSGWEQGFLSLNISDDNSSFQRDDYPIESCYNGIWTYSACPASLMGDVDHIPRWFELDSSRAMIEDMAFYYIEDYNKEESRIIMLDLEDCTIESFVRKK